MKNIVYVVANVTTETVLVVTTNKQTAYTAAYVAQQLGARKKDVSITPMKLDVQVADGTAMCYDDNDIADAMRELEDWEDWDEDEDEDEYEDEDEEEDEDWDDDVDETNYNPYMGCDEIECDDIW